MPQVYHEQLIITMPRVPCLGGVANLTWIYLLIWWGFFGQICGNRGVSKGQDFAFVNKWFTSKTLLKSNCDAINIPYSTSMKSCSIQLKKSPSEELSEDI